MSKSTQCVKPPASGASGSCMISTNDFVLAGASFHDSAGDGFVIPASHVNFDGMFPPSVNAGLEMENAAARTITPTIETPTLVGADPRVRPGRQMGRPLLGLQR